MCIPIIFGCNTKISPEGEETRRVCPQCHNVSVLSAKSTTWFELFWIPLLPISRKHVWVCGICQWSQNVAKDQAQKAGPVPAGSQQTYAAPNQPGYQPAYIGQGGPNP